MAVWGVFLFDMYLLAFIIIIVVVFFYLLICLFIEWLIVMGGGTVGVIISFPVGTPEFVKLDGFRNQVGWVSHS